MAYTPEDNKAIVRKMLDAFNTANTGVVRELFHPQMIDHSRALGLEPALRNEPAVRRVQTEIMREQEVFPDRQFKELILLAEGDQVVLRWEMTGTHKGAAFGRPATGRRIKTRGTEFVRIKDGKIIEHDDDPFHILDILWQLDLLTPEILRQPEFSGRHY